MSGDESRLYTFIDETREFALYFLEGQRLIEQLALTHPIRGEGFHYFRDVVLSIQPLIALLNHGEQIGVYIDSDEPYFRLKIEANHHGSTRSMLLPADFEQFPKTMHGLVRLFRMFPGGRPPYESVLQIEGLALREIVNRVLRESYEVNGTITVSQTADQSVLLHQLPPLKDEYEVSLQAVRERRSGIREGLRGIFARALSDLAEIQSAFREIGFRFLAVREVQFRCSCSRAGMVQNLGSVYKTEGDKLFDPGQLSLHATCEYCKSGYEISRLELDQSSGVPN